MFLSQADTSIFKHDLFCPVLVTIVYSSPRSLESLILAFEAQWKRMINFHLKISWNEFHARFSWLIISTRTSIPSSHPNVEARRYTFVNSAVDKISPAICFAQVLIKPSSHDLALLSAQPWRPKRRVKSKVMAAAHFGAKTPAIGRRHRQLEAPSPACKRIWRSGLMERPRDVLCDEL